MREALYFSSVHIEFFIKNVEVKVDVQKGALGSQYKLTIDVLVQSNSGFHPLLPYGNSPK